MKLEWNEAYSVGVKELDDQHKKLFDLLGEIERMSAQEDLKNAIYVALDELMEYVMIHFHTEEMYMKSAEYPEFDAHYKKHQKISQDVNMRVNYMMNKELNALDLVMIHNFLADWLKEHILGEDLCYKAYVQHLEQKE